MKRRTAGGLAALALLAAAPAGRGLEGTVLGPFTHRNLSVFVICGAAPLDGRDYLTLAEGLDRGIVVVRETGNVRELGVENTSRSRTVFLQAGDLVKGGRQDRALRHDLILPPRSGPVPLAAFCVERGRWSPRGREEADRFAKNSAILPSRKLRIAATAAGDQAAVWAGVAEQQARLNENAARVLGVEVEVRHRDSETSLQLTLECPALDKAVAGYLDALGDAPGGRRDAIGFLYAIGGEIHSADVYANAALFRAQWPRLLRAAATEAVSKLDERAPRRPLSPDDLPPFFSTALSGAAVEQEIWTSTRLRTRTTATTLLLETLDVDAGGRWLHKCFLLKGDDGVVVPLDRGRLPARAL